MTYVFDNSASVARDRLSALAAVHDRGTIRHLDAIGLGEGWRCLEIGGGGGAITRWLSQRVGPSGHVLTTDIDTRFLDTLHLANVDVMRHNILQDPLPPATFDLAFARLVLEHLPDPDAALDRMVSAVKPGGWLLIEDLEARPPGFRSGDSIDDIPPSLAALMELTDRSGIQWRLGASLPSRMRARGLIHVQNEGRLRICHGGGADARLAELNLEQLREPILAMGRVTAEELDADRARLSQPGVEWRSPIMWTAWGQRPVTPA